MELKSNCRESPSPLPFGAFNTRDYLSFLHWKKVFEIVPLTTVDAQIVIKYKTTKHNKNNKLKVQNGANDESHLEDDRLIIPSLREQFFNSLKNDSSNKRNRVGADSGPDNPESEFLESLIVSATFDEWLQINVSLKQIGIYLGKKNNMRNEIIS